MNEILLQQLMRVWSEIYSENQSDATRLNNELEQMTILKFADNNKIFACIVNLVDLNIEYATPNCQDVLGIKVEINNTESFNTLLGCLDPEHVEGLSMMIEEIRALAPDLKKWTGIESFTYSICGVKYIHSQKSNIRLLNRNVVLEFNEHNQPIKVLRLFQDITHLVKSDLFCMRMKIIGRERTFLMSKRSDSNEYVKQDLLSDREKEILILIAQGKETDEIAKILFISKTTVNNHRQNMLNKIGVRDITALIQIARLTKLI